MKILVVDCYDESKRGRNLFNGFFRTLDSCIKESGPLSNDVELLVRRCNEIGDLIMDWETESLDKESLERVTRFDTFDVICIGGDMNECPWHPRNMQVITLIHMANEINKPLLTVGGGTFLAVYSASTCGKRFFILNDPLGDTIDKLPLYPRYALDTIEHPCGWLDNETGDVYSYKDDSKLWTPVCNIGMFRIANSGKPSRPNSAVPKHLSKDDRSLTDEVDPQANYFDERETSVHIRNIHVQSRYLKTLASQNFIACEVPNWHINNDGALPVNYGVFVMAENKRGPIILGRGPFGLYIGAEINQGRSYSSMKTIILNYMTAVNDDIRAKGSLGNKLRIYLVGDETGIGKQYDPLITSKRKFAPTLAASAIPSSLPGGPTKVSAPVFSLFFNEAESAKEFTLNNLRKNNNRVSTLKQKKQNKLRHPLMARRRRLGELLLKTGNTDMINLKEQIRDEVDAENPYEQAPNSAREFMSGKMMGLISMSGRATEMRKARIGYIDNDEREKRNEGRQEAMQQNAKKIREKGLSKREKAARAVYINSTDEITDELSVHTASTESVEVVKEGNRVFMKTKVRQRPHSATQLGGHKHKMNTDPSFIPSVDMMRPLTAVSDWNKLEMKHREEEKLKSRLPNDKTELIHWASQQGMHFGPGGLSIDILEQHYQLEKDKVKYLPPNSPERIQRETEEMRALKLAQRTGEIDPSLRGSRIGTDSMLPTLGPDGSYSLVGVGSARPMTVGSPIPRPPPSEKGGASPDLAQEHAEAAILTRVKTAPSVFNRPGSAKVRIQSSNPKPYNNMKKFDQMKLKDKISKYNGTYSEPYRSEYDKEQHYLRVNRNRWTGGHFRTAFGPNGGLPLRKEGQIAPGVFPQAPNDGATRLVAKDWFLIRKMDKSKNSSKTSWKVG